MKQARTTANWRPAARDGRLGWRCLAALVAAAALAGSAAAVSTPATRGLELVVSSTGNSGDASPGDGVCETAPGNGVCTLRAAIQEANARPGADTVTIVTTQHILVPSGIGLLITDDLTIRSGNGGMAKISGQSVSPIFAISGGTYPDVDLVDLQLEYALSGEVGSVVWVESGGDLSLTGCVLLSNTSLLGGAIGVDGESGDVLIDSCVFADNPIPGYDGGLGPLANRGGAIFISGTPINQRGQLIIRSSTFNYNRAVNGGGAIAVVNTFWDLMVFESSFVANGMDNGSGGNGGAIEVVSSSAPTDRALALLERSSFTYNDAPEGFGGAVAASDADLRLVNCTLALNWASVGGAVFASGGSAALSQTTIKGNSATVAGGGLFATEGTTVLAAAAVLDANDPVNCSSPETLDGDYNLSSDASCGFVGAENLLSIPAGLGPGSSSGGGLVSYPPAPGSPALDSGGPGPCLDAFGAVVGDDQDGLPRPTDGDGDSLVRCDRGARELPTAGEVPLFADDFENGNLDRWSAAMP